MSHCWLCLNVEDFSTHVIRIQLSELCRICFVCLQNQHHGALIRNFLFIYADMFHLAWLLTQFENRNVSSKFVSLTSNHRKSARNFEVDTCLRICFNHAQAGNIFAEIIKLPNYIVPSASTRLANVKHTRFSIPIALHKFSHLVRWVLLLRFHVPRQKEGKKYIFSSLQTTLKIFTTNNYSPFPDTK